MVLSAQSQAPALSTPGKDLAVPAVHEAGWPPGLPNNPGFDSWTLRTVAVCLYNSAVSVVELICCAHVNAWVSLVSDSAEKSAYFFSRGIHCAVISLCRHFAVPLAAQWRHSDCSPQAKVGKVPLGTNIERVFPEDGDLSTADIAAVCPVSCSNKYSNIQNIIRFIVNGLRSECSKTSASFGPKAHNFFQFQVRK